MPPTRPSDTVRRASFAAMGCQADVVVVGGPENLVARAGARIAWLERCWSRFIPNSDISRINRGAGGPVEVDPSTVRLISAMVSGWVLSAGMFDPSQLAPLVGLGYQTSWRDPAAVTSLSEPTMPHTPLDQILVDTSRNVVVTPVGIGLDAGGIGKGLAADVTVEELLALGAEGASVSIGGDVRVSGVAPHPGGWGVAVTNEADSRHDVIVYLSDGAVATSGTQRRVWTDATGERQHHLLDPATSKPIDTSRAGVPLVEATVVAGTGAWAEVWTKAILVGGPARVMPELTTRGLAARAVYADGSVEHNQQWHDIVSEEVLG